MEDKRMDKKDRRDREREEDWDWGVEQDKGSRKGRRRTG